MDAQIEQLKVMATIAQRRADAALAALSTKRAAAETAGEVVAARQAKYDAYQASLPEKVAELRRPIERRSDVRSSDIFAMQVGKVALEREADALLAEVKLAQQQRTNADAAVAEAAQAAQTARNRAEKFTQALKEMTRDQFKKEDIAADLEQ